MLLAILGIIALGLTIAMFATRQAMLGFACGLFWALTGAQSYSLRTGTWADVYFLFAIASLLGMVALTILGAFGLREKGNEVDDEEGQAGEEDDEVMDNDEESSSVMEGGELSSKSRPSRRTAGLRERASRRRTGEGREKKINWGEFK